MAHRTAHAQNLAPAFYPLIPRLIISSPAPALPTREVRYGSAPPRSTGRARREEARGSVIKHDNRFAVARGGSRFFDRTRKRSPLRSRSVKKKTLLPQKKKKKKENSPVRLSVCRIASTRRSVKTCFLFSRVSRLRHVINRKIGRIVFDGGACCRHARTECVAPKRFFDARALRSLSITEAVAKTTVVYASRVSYPRPPHLSPAARDRFQTFRREISVKTKG